MTTLDDFEVINSQLTIEEIREKHFKSSEIVEFTSLYTPVYIVEMEIELKHLFSAIKRKGAWALDAIQGNVNITKSISSHKQSLDEGYVLQAEISPEESIEYAELATLKEKFKFLKKPKFLSTKYKKTIYHPYFMVMTQKKDKNKLMVYSAVTGEENLILREMMRIPYNLK